MTGDPGRQGPDADQRAAELLAERREDGLPREQPGGVLRRLFPLRGGDVEMARLEQAVDCLLLMSWVSQIAVSFEPPTDPC